MDIREFFEGRAFDAYEYFGAHPVDGGVQFRLYAPGAAQVCLVGDFNGWQEWNMETDNTGIYSLYVPGASCGQYYKYRIKKQGGKQTDHCDPYGFAMELRPGFASRITDYRSYTFQDEDWMAGRDKNYNKPMNIYELHLGSWRTKDTFQEINEDAAGEYLATPEECQAHWFTYAEIADELIDYIKSNHYTHIELMPLSEHPADCSWGYQNTGFFSPTSRYGSPDELKQLIDKCHAAGIGVITDFVPIHFATDEYALAKLTGQAVYEYPHDSIGYSEWGTCNFALYRGEVRSFLQSAANYWLREFHFDGIRMDAISRAIYWQGDSNRGVNSQAVYFIKYMNKGLHDRHPSALIMAEDSTAFLKVTAPVEYDGLGFDYKWDMGWMNDTLEYFKLHPLARCEHYYDLKFSMNYFYSELFLLPLSHDEVVHGKATIIQKMWGLYGDKFKQARAFYMYMYTHPGKKLNFMGNEIGQFREWDEKREPDWDILKYPAHDAFHRYMMRLNELYVTTPALYENEYHPACFRWIVEHDREHSVFAYIRQGEVPVLTIFNFIDIPHHGYQFILPEGTIDYEILNSDWDLYDGDTKMHTDTKDYQIEEKEDCHIVTLDLPPFTGRMFALRV